MIKRIQTLALLVAAGALLAVPAVGEADRPDATGKHNHPNTGKSCAKKPTVKKGFVVKGTVVSYTGGVLTVTVTKANKHARVSGEITNGTYTVPASDAFKVQLSEYETGETPGAGDKARIIGKVTVTKKKCAPSGTSVADRYGDVDVKKVKFTEVD